MRSACDQFGDVPAALHRRKRSRCKKAPLLGKHAQQPADVVARSAQHRVQPVAGFALEVAAVHAVIGLEVGDDRLNRLAPPQLLSLLLADSFGLARVHDVHIRVPCIHARPTNAVAALTALSCIRVVACSICSFRVWPSYGLPWNARAHDQVALVRAGNAYLHLPELALDHPKPVCDQSSASARQYRFRWCWGSGLLTQARLGQAGRGQWRRHRAVPREERQLKRVSRFSSL